MELGFTRTHRFSRFRVIPVFRGYFIPLKIPLALIFEHLYIKTVMERRLRLGISVRPKLWWTLAVVRSAGFSLSEKARACQGPGMGSNENCIKPNNTFWDKNRKFKNGMAQPQHLAAGEMGQLSHFPGDPLPRHGRASLPAQPMLQVNPGINACTLNGSHGMANRSHLRESAVVPASPNYILRSDEVPARSHPGTKPGRPRLPLPKGEGSGEVLVRFPRAHQRSLAWCTKSFRRGSTVHMNSIDSKTKQSPAIHLVAFAQPDAFLAKRRPKNPKSGLLSAGFGVCLVHSTTLWQGGRESPPAQAFSPVGRQSPRAQAFSPVGRESPRAVALVGRGESLLFNGSTVKRFNHPMVPPRRNPQSSQNPASPWMSGAIQKCTPCTPMHSKSDPIRP